MIFDFGLPIADWRSATLLEEKFRGREFSGLCFQNQKSEIANQNSRLHLGGKE
jgi:hypothetical protein